jgi:hypothetical protein
VKSCRLSKKSDQHEKYCCTHYRRRAMTCGRRLLMGSIGSQENEDVAELRPLQLPDLIYKRHPPMQNVWWIKCKTIIPERRLKHTPKAFGFSRHCRLLCRCCLDLSYYTVTYANLSLTLRSLTRTQLPVKLAFDMTVYKTHVNLYYFGIDLQHKVFAHG